MIIAEDFDRMFRDHHGLVYRTAYRVTGNPADAEDVVQTLFLRLLRHRYGPGLRENPGGYLRRASVNIALDIIRSRKHDAPADSQLDVTKTIEPTEAQDLVRSALGQLSPKLAELFVLRHVEGYYNNEIAEMFGMSYATVAVLLFRARTRLKKALMEKIHETD